MATTAGLRTRCCLVTRSWRSIRNDQRATTLWYHDHAMAITALNVMSELMGMYLIRDAEEDALELPDGKHEAPLMSSGGSST